MYVWTYDLKIYKHKKYFIQYAYSCFCKKKKLLKSIPHTRICIKNRLPVFDVQIQWRIDKNYNFKTDYNYKNITIITTLKYY